MEKIIFELPLTGLTAGAPAFIATCDELARIMESNGRNKIEIGFSNGETVIFTEVIK